MKLYYVYELINPFTNEVFYVGKGQGARMYHHASTVKSGKVPHGNWNLFREIKKIHKLNGKIKYNTVYEGYDEDVTYDFEYNHINEIGFHNLCNLFNGRGGVYSGKNHPRYGKIHSEETKRKIGMKSKGRVKSEETISKMTFKGEAHPMYGKHHSDSSKQLMSENHADFNGDSNPFYGKTHSEETKRNMSNKLSDNWLLILPNGVSYELLGKQSVKQFINEYNSINNTTISFNSLSVYGKNGSGWILKKKVK